MAMPPDAPHAADPSPALPPQVAKTWLVRWALRALAVVCIALGVAGVFIPGLPTTVFILMAGWAAMRSSPRLHHWLWQHRLFGPMLRNWAAGGRVSRRAKYSATATMAVCGLLLWLLPMPIWVQCLAGGCMVVVCMWLWCRPEPDGVTDPQRS